MKICVLSANLGNFDKPINSVKQNLPEGWKVDFHTFTDSDFPPIIGLTPRLQYRIPKMFGWQMFPGYDYYIWLDGSMSLQDSDSVKWLMEKIGNNDALFFLHPWRKTITKETEHIEQKLKEGNKYITSRYKGGLHKEQLAECSADSEFRDTVLYASTAFVYRNIPSVRQMMKDWWCYQSRYFTVDQIVLPYVIWKNRLSISEIEDDIFHCKYITLTSKHK